MEAARILANGVGALNLGLACAGVIQRLAAPGGGAATGFAAWPSVAMHGAIGGVRLLLPQTGAAVVLYHRLAVLWFAPLTGLGWGRRRLHPGSTAVAGLPVDGGARAVYASMVVTGLLGLRLARRGWTWLDATHPSSERPY